MGCIFHYRGRPFIEFSLGDSRTRVHTVEETKQMIDIFLEYGHQDIDTARIYGNGSSEEFLGKMNLTSVSLDTKLFPSAANMTVAASSIKSYHHTPEDLRCGLMASLKALRLSKVHVFYLHSPDRTVAFEDTLREVNRLYQEGYFGKMGISNYQSWEVATICYICEKNGWVKPSVCQGIYNAFHRAVEPELLRCLRHHSISFYCFNPLAAGMLTSRYTRETDEYVAGGRFDPRTGPGKLTRKRYHHSLYFDALDCLRPVASRFGINEVSCALRWLSHHSQLKSSHGDGIVIGSSSTAQLKENLEAMREGPLPQEIVDALDEGWRVIQGKELIYWH